MAGSFSIGIKDTTMIAGGPEIAMICYIPWILLPGGVRDTDTVSEDRSNHGMKHLL